MFIRVIRDWLWWAIFAIMQNLTCMKNKIINAMTGVRHCVPIQFIGCFLGSRIILILSIIVASMVMSTVLILDTPKGAQAHGGIIIESDITNGYEWLLAVNPFPMTPGEISLALLVYDTEENYAPMNELAVELYLAAPSNPNPCCNAEQHMGPIELEILPDIYPGDYSAFVNLQEEGEWVAKYIIIDEGKAPMELIIPFEVRPLDPNQPRPTLESFSTSIYPQPTLIDDEAPMNESDALPAPEPSPIPASETSQPTLWSNVSTLFANNLWLWGLVAIIPIGMIVMVIFLSSTENNWTDDDLEEYPEEDSEKKFEMNDIQE